MSILSAHYVGQSFGDFDLFSGISASIPNDGKIGLVGPNGIGKTTLLLILAGLSQPSRGSVSLARGARIGYLPQESSDAFTGSTHTVYEEMLAAFADLRAAEKVLHDLENQMSQGDHSGELLARYSQMQQQFELEGGYHYPIRIKQVLTGLGFTPDDWQLPLSYLSGGQKTRALLARLLLEKPNLLVLDEPTNHLDVEAIEWLEGALRVWEGAILVVSHDRYFLDRVVNTVWEMTRTGLTVYRGNYSAYVQQRQDHWQWLEQDFLTFKEQAAKELDFIRRNIAGQRTQMAQGKLSRLAREVEAVRAGGLGVLAQLRSKGWLQVAVGLDLRRPASTPDELHQRLQELRGPRRPTTLNMTLRPSQRSGNIILRTRELQVGYPGYAPLFVADDIELMRQECAALIGGNGTGKTTFLRTILAELTPAAGEISLGASLKVGYFSQTQEHLHPDDTVLEEFSRHTNMLPGEARSYLARFLFQGDDVFKQVRTLSGGERSRLALAILTLGEANFLLLDEPTNHLDIPAQEVLQAALEAYTGTVLLVTHDRYLVDRLASQIWEVRDGCLRVFAGSYQEYLAQRQQEAAQEKEARLGQETAVFASTTPAATNGTEARSKNESRRRAAALAAVEAEIAYLEEQLAAISQALQEAATAQDFDKTQSLGLEYARLESQLTQQLETWENMHD